MFEIMIIESDSINDLKIAFSDWTKNHLGYMIANLQFQAVAIESKRGTTMMYYISFLFTKKTNLTIA